jgi:hypothetical protein
MQEKNYSYIDHQQTSHLNDKGDYYVGMKKCNALNKSTAKLVKDKKHFISALKRYLNDRSFYLTDEYLLTDIR